MAFLDNLINAWNSDILWRALTYDRLARSKDQIQNAGMNIYCKRGINIFAYDNSAKDAINALLFHGGAGYLPNLAYSAEALYHIQSIDQRYWSQATADNIANLSIANCQWSPPAYIYSIPAASMRNISAKQVLNLGTVYAPKVYLGLSSAQVQQFGAAFSSAMGVSSKELINLLNDYYTNGTNLTAEWKLKPHFNETFWTQQLLSIDSLNPAHFSAISYAQMTSIHHSNLYWASRGKFQPFPRRHSKPSRPRM